MEGTLKDRSSRSRSTRKSKNKREWRKSVYLSIGSAIFFDGPTRLDAKSLQDLVVIAVFGKVEVPLSSKPSIYLRRHSPSPPLSPPVVLSLPPWRFSSSRRCWRCSIWRHFPAKLASLSLSASLFCAMWVRFRGFKPSGEREKREGCSRGMRFCFFAVGEEESLSVWTKIKAKFQTCYDTRGYTHKHWRAP